MDRASFYHRQSVLDRLLRSRDAGKLGQPFLLVGPEGSGKENTALEFARRVNCIAPETCCADDLCESCVKALTFQHPDIKWIGPAPAATDETAVCDLFAAKIANPFHQSGWASTSYVGIGDPEHPGPLTIRSVIHFLRRRAFQGAFKVVVVADGQRLNQAAANAFLKTLEEPPERTVIFLLTTGDEGMLPTIVSRCQKVYFEPWTESELMDILHDLRDVEPDAARDAARLADGNARQALALLQPEARLLKQWAGRLFDWIHDGDRAMAAVAADEMHRGQISHACLPADVKAKELDAKDLAQRRARAITLCELLNLHFSDAVACLELGDQWRPRLLGAESGIRRHAGTRLTSSLLRDMMAIDDAARELDRNINIGLVMATLCEGLIDHARDDQRHTRAATA